MNEDDDEDSSLVFIHTSKCGRAGKRWSCRTNKGVLVELLEMSWSWGGPVNDLSIVHVRLCETHHGCVWSVPVLNGP